MTSSRQLIEHNLLGTVNILEFCKRHGAGFILLSTSRIYNIARLAALVPRPRVNLTRYHGVLAPNHRWRAEVTPSGRGRGKGRSSAQPERSGIERHAAMTWERRLKRVFGIDVESCVRCGKAVRVIASIEEPALIERILAHVREKAGASTAAFGPPSTGPPIDGATGEWLSGARKTHES